MYLQGLSELIENGQLCPLPAAGHVLRIEFNGVEKRHRHSTLPFIRAGRLARDPQTLDTARIPKNGIDNLSIEGVVS